MTSLVEKVYASISATTAEQPAAEVTITDPLGGRVGTLGNAFALILNILMGVGWALVFVMLALGFIQYIMSRGEKTAVENAQKWLTYAVIGGVGLFFIFVLKTIIPQLLGGSVAPGGGVVEF